MANLNRRDFLKALGVTSSASALTACGLDNNVYSTPVESVLPYVVKPDQVTPGTYTFFATTVTRGPHALPVTARHRDGRVTFVSANFGVKGVKPPTGPAVPQYALFELQNHYSPDRLTGPTDGGAAKKWDDALGALTADVSAAVAAGKKVAYLGGYKSGAIVELITAFTQGNAVFWEPAGYGPLAKASELLFGTRTLPFYAVDKATYVLSFGAPFLGGWGDAGLPDRFASARNPNIDHTVARFAAVAPHRDQTAAKADDFFAVVPGSEVVVARAIAGIVATDKGASDAIKNLIGKVSVDDAAKASGLTAEQISGIAKNFSASKSVALPGGASGSTDLAVATYLLNLAGSADGSLFHLGGYAGPVADLSAVKALINDLKSGAIGVLLVDDANPAYALPAKLGFVEALKNTKVVSLSSQPTETQKLAKLTLPTSDVFEDWGDEHPFAGLSLLRQPASATVHDTRSLGDILLAVGRSASLPAGTGLGFGPQTWRDYVSAWWQAHVYTPADGVFADFWETSLIHGFVSREVTPAAPVVTATSYAFGEFKAPAAGELSLHVHTHTHRLDGRYAGSPWAQEVADPLTGQVWGSWLEVSPARAQELGVEYDDLVEVSTDGGKVEVGVVILPTCHKDTVALALGQGHTDSGRYANKYGVNAFSLLTGAEDGAGATAITPTRASVKKLGAKAGLITTFSIYGTSDEGRHFGAHVDATKLAKVGDAPGEEPGSLTGLHGLELDARLRERKISDFYGLPDHPTYRFGLTVDTNACTGCSACQVACYAENNLAIVGPKKVAAGREMTWIRVNRYWESNVGGTDDVRFVPMMCQQCGHAGCENVCPVLATYHNLDGLNAMIYNRCVGTRYCANACPFSVRRFNYHTYLWPESYKPLLNPDVTARQAGVMEKCTFCVQRLRATKAAFKEGGNFTRTVPSEVWESVPACVEACPSQALTFGNIKDEESKVGKARKSPRAYWPLEDLNVFSAVTYLAKASFHDDPSAHHGGGHGAEAGHESKSEHAGGEAAGADASKGHEATGH